MQRAELESIALGWFCPAQLLQDQAVTGILGLLSHVLTIGLIISTKGKRNVIFGLEMSVSETYGQDGRVCRYALHPNTTKRRTTKN